MRRRAVIAGATAAIASPTASRGQSAPPLVGVLRSTGAAGFDGLVEAFRNGLVESGFVDGRDVVIEFSWGDNRPEQLAGMAADLVARKPAVIVGNTRAALAAKAATATLPIVFVGGEDPIRIGLVASLARPAGNVTGIMFTGTDLAAKRFGMMHEMTPRLAPIAVLCDPTTPDSDAELKSVEEAARMVERRVLVARAATDEEIDAAFDEFVRGGAHAVYVGIGSLYSDRRDRLVALAVRHRLPATYSLRHFAESGGLLSYGPSQPEAYRRAGVYVARILKGAKPADLPVELPTKYELVVNQRAAKAISFEFPPLLLANADEVIE